MLPNKLPPGWMTIRDCVALDMHASRVPEGGIIVEVGSFFGRSACVLANAAKGSTVYCIDRWIKGAKISQKAIDNMNSPDYTYLDDHLAGFLHYTRDYPNIIPIKGESPLDDVPFERQVDLVFLDGSHNSPGIDNDIRWAYEKLCKPGGLIMGHDYHEAWPDVIAAVDKFVAEKNMTLFRPIIHSSIWACML